MGTPCPTATAGREHGAGRRGNCGLQRPDSRPEVGTKHVENVAELVCTASAPTLLFNAIEPQVCNSLPLCLRAGATYHTNVSRAPRKTSNVDGDVGGAFLCRAPQITRLTWSRGLRSPSQGSTCSRD